MNVRYLIDQIQNQVAGVLFGVGFLSTLFLTPLVMRWARRLGAVDRGGHRKLHRGGVPLLGGVAVGLPLLTLCLLGAAVGRLTIARWEWVARRLPAWFDPVMTLAESRGDLLVFALGAAAIAAVGMIDDARGLRARFKLLCQIAVAVGVVLPGNWITAISLPLIGTLEFGDGWGIFLSCLWIVGLINAFNLVDGVDGLAAGLALIACAALAVMSAWSGASMVLFVCALLGGSLLAFLFFNFHPARIFLGDTGSMLLGYALAVVTLLGAYRSETAVIVLAPLLALSFPIFETLVSMLRRYVRGLPIFVGDSRHTHHRLLSRGYSQRQVVLLLYGVAFLLALAGVLSQLLPERGAWGIVPLALYLLTLVWITWLAGYLRPAMFDIAFQRRQRNRLLNAAAKYAVLALGAYPERARRDQIVEFLRQEGGLSFLECWFESDKSIIGSAGAPPPESSQPREFDPIERMRANSFTGHTVVVRFVFEGDPDELTRRDVTTALARVFENAVLQPQLPPPGDTEATEEEDLEDR